MSTPADKLGRGLSGLPLMAIEKQITHMHNPPHPGEVLADTVLRSDSGLTVTEFARRIGVSRVALSRVVNGRAAVSPELAIRLAAELGGSAESWLNMQNSHDLWKAQRLPRLLRFVKRLTSRKSARRLYRRTRGAWR